MHSVEFLKRNVFTSSHTRLDGFHVTFSANYSKFLNIVKLKKNIFMYQSKEK